MLQHWGNNSQYNTQQAGSMWPKEKTMLHKKNENLCSSGTGQPAMEIFYKKKNMCRRLKRKVHGSRI